MPEEQGDRRPQIGRGVIERVKKELSRESSNDRPTLEQQLRQAGMQTANVRPTTETVSQQYREDVKANIDPQLVAEAEKRLEEVWRRGDSFYEMAAAEINLLRVKGEHRQAANFRALFRKMRREERKAFPARVTDAQKRLEEAQQGGDIDDIDAAKIMLYEIEGRLEEAEAIRRAVQERKSSGKLGIPDEAK